MGTSLHPLIPASASMESGPVASLPVSKLWKRAQNRMVSAVAPTPGRASNQITRENTRTRKGGERNGVFFCPFCQTLLKIKKSDFETN